MHRRTKATSIPKKVKDAVWERDGQRCIVCGDSNGSPCAHIVSRAKSGLGIETNIVTLCANCHRLYDNSSREIHDRVDSIIVKHMKSIYGDGWCKEDQVYKKW